MAKKYTQLTERERYHLELLLQEPSLYSQNKIAKVLGRSKSTISREIRRNKDNNGKYHSEIAVKFTFGRRKRKLPSRFTLIAKNVIKDKLEDGWTPEQISAYLKEEHNIFASHELIYQHINKNRKGGGKLYLLLPRRGVKYKKRNVKERYNHKKSAVAKENISKRPRIVSKKLEVGHWEGDTVESKGHRGGIGTFVDIKAKYTIIRKVKNKTAEEMESAIINSFSGCPDLLKTLTVDNGNEFANHDNISKSLDAKVYFANPYSPWERGLNENTNGLIRRVYPKGTDFAKIPDYEIQKVQDLLNNRPRKSLGYKTPKEVFIEEIKKKYDYYLTEEISRVTPPGV